MRVDLGNSLWVPQKKQSRLQVSRPGPSKPIHREPGLQLALAITPLRAWRRHGGGYIQRERERERERERREREIHLCIDLLFVA